MELGPFISPKTPRGNKSSALRWTPIVTTSDICIIARTWQLFPLGSLRYGPVCRYPAAVPHFALRYQHYGPDSWNKNVRYIGALRFARRHSFSSGSIAEITGCLYGDGSTCSPTAMLSILFKSFLGMVCFLFAKVSCGLMMVHASVQDYGESHYMAPVRGAQPNSEAWVDGFPHSPWLALNAYFMRAFKEGRMPPIKHDKIFVWARPHPKDATALDTVPRPRNWELVSPRSPRELHCRRLKRRTPLQTDDKFWVVVFARAPCIALLSAGDEPPRQFTCPPGVSKLACPLKIGCGMRAELVRDSIVVARCHPREFRFQAEPEVYNFNVYVAASE